MAGVGRLSNQASQQRYRSKNRERITINRKINYRKQKIRQYEKEIKELQKKAVEEKR